MMKWIFKMQTWLVLIITIFSSKFAFAAENVMLILPDALTLRNIMGQPALFVTDQSGDQKTIRMTFEFQYDDTMASIVSQLGNKSLDLDFIEIPVSVEEAEILLLQTSLATSVQSIKKFHLGRQYRVEITLKNNLPADKLKAALLQQLAFGTVQLKADCNANEKFAFCKGTLPAIPMLNHLVSTTPEAFNRRQMQRDFTYLNSFKNRLIMMLSGRIESYDDLDFIVRQEIFPGLHCQSPNIKHDQRACELIKQHSSDQSLSNALLELSSKAFPDFALTLPLSQYLYKIDSSVLNELKNQEPLQFSERLCQHFGISQSSCLTSKDICDQMPWHVGCTSMYSHSGSTHVQEAPVCKNEQLQQKVIVWPKPTDIIGCDPSRCTVDPNKSYPPIIINQGKGSSSGCDETHCTVDPNWISPINVPGIGKPNIYPIKN